MEDDQIQTPISSSNYSNGGPTPSKMGPGPPVGFPNEGDMVVMGGNNRLRQWPHSSRIIRVSRASGGKDRHSKVWTAKGPRDRRVRLSVSTAIQFYDLQDRLGYDQPSKAVEWLIKAASDAIHELPSLNSMNFPPETPRQSSGEPRGGGGLLGDVEMDGQNQMGGCASKSGCSSNNSENSKGSGLSLSRSEIRVKARERARERTAKEKEKEPEPPAAQRQQQLGRRVDVDANNQEQQNVDLVAPTSSFTQLLTAGINNLKYENNGGGGGGNANTSASPRGANSQWLSSTSATVTPMDYISGGGGGILSPNSTRANHLTSGYQTGSIHVGSGVTLAQIMTYNHHNQNTSHENQLHHHNHHQHQQHYPYVGDNQQMYQASGSGGSDYNLSFSISSSTSASSGGHIGAGYNNNRGPLQSNSASAQTLLPYLPRYATTTDGSNVPFFLGGAAVENQHHQHFHPTGLQLCYGDSNQHSDQKGKGKN